MEAGSSFITCSLIYYFSSGATTSQQVMEGYSTKEIDFLKKAPAGSPNILLIILDDVGYGATSPFGGLIILPI